MKGYHQNFIIFSQIIDEPLHTVVWLFFRRQGAGAFDGSYRTEVDALYCGNCFISFSSLCRCVIKPPVVFESGIVR